MIWGTTLKKYRAQQSWSALDAGVLGTHSMLKSYQGWNKMYQIYCSCSWENVPRRIKRRLHQHQIIWAGAEIHPSHDLMHYAGCVYCTKCARYAIEKCTKLKETCPKVMNVAGPYHIRTILNRDPHLTPTWHGKTISNFIDTTQEEPQRVWITF